MKIFLSIFLSLFLTLSSARLCAQDLQHLDKNSYYTYIYRIPADSVMSLGTGRDFDYSLSFATLVDSFATGSTYAGKLAPGHYYQVSIVDGVVHFDYKAETNIKAVILSDYKINKLIVHTRDGLPMTDAVISYRRQKIRYNPIASAYLIPFSNEDGRVLTIEAHGEKLFFDYYTDEPVRPDRGERRESRLSQHKKHTEKLNGYIIFNKPKYAPGDTVLLKAYLLHKNNRVYKEPLRVQVVRPRGYTTPSQYMVLADQLSPGRPGVYTFSFVVTDSFELDYDYSLSFARISDGTILESSSFRVEDYLLDKNTYKFLVDGQYADRPVSDTIRMTASAYSANGMNAMDCRVRVTATAGRVYSWYTDRDCVQDTLFVMEKKLSATGDTKMFFPLEWLPDVHMAVHLHVDFVNSAAEHQSRDAFVNISKNPRSIVVHQEYDTIYADLMVHGRSVAGYGDMQVTGRYEEPLASRSVTFPLHVRVDPFGAVYRFRAFDGDTVSARLNAEGHGEVYCRRTDTSIIIYPYSSGALLLYTLYLGDRIIARGDLHELPVIIPDRTRRTYRLLIQSVEEGKPQYQGSTILPLGTGIHLTLQQSDVVYPGKRDSVTITVTDGKGHPRAGTDITALSINALFYKEYNLRSLRHDRGYFSDRRYSGVRESVCDLMDDAGTVADLSRSPYWLRRAHADTMLYYRLIYPSAGRMEYTIPVPGLLAQFSPFIFDHGRSVGIHMVYVDGALAYYDGSASFMPYAIPVTAGRHSIALRTTDRMLHVDSVTIRDGYKTELSLEWDSLIAHADTMSAELSVSEKNLMSSKFIYYQQQRNNDSAYIWQDGSRLVFSFPPYYSTASAQIFAPVGPLSYHDKANFYVPHNFTVPFEAERGYAFSFNPAVARLQSFDLFASAHVFLAEDMQKRDIRFGEILYPHPEVDLLPARWPVLSSLYHVSSLYHSEHHVRGYSDLDISIASDSSIAYLRVYRTDSLGYDMIAAYSSSASVVTLAPGTYTIQAFTSSGFSYSMAGIAISPYASCRLVMRPHSFADPYHKTFKALISSAGFTDKTTSFPALGGSAISGHIYDSSGADIPGAGVEIVDSKGQVAGRSTITDRYGFYIFPDMATSSYQIVISAMGYDDRSVQHIMISKGRSSFTSLRLNAVKPQSLLSTTLSPVEVITYKKAIIDRQDTKIATRITYSGRSKKTDLEQAINKTPGVQADDGEVQYLVNGHRLIGSVNVPTGGLSVANAASNTVGVTQMDVMHGLQPFTGSVSGKYGDSTWGVINIDSAYQDAGKIRGGFRDYAYWQPDLTTDKNGKASFIAHYPDNITTWHSVAIAMNRRHQIAADEGYTKSYKQCMAEIATPLFLLAGDSSSAAIRITDYLGKPIALKAAFVWDGRTILENDVTVTDILTDVVPVAVSPTEKKAEIKTSFNISTKGGFGDGEERSIAVLPQGTKETVGAFASLHGDTSITLPLDTSAGAVTIHAESDILDILLDEVDHVRKYPYWCMEQTASRLVMLTMLKKISASLGKPFKLQKEKTACISKLQKGQLVNGAYGWWEYSPASVRLTTYVLSALGKAGISEGVNVKDAYSYLDAAYGLMTTGEKLNTLELYAERSRDPARVVSGLHKIPFDSLSVYEQLQYHKAELLTGAIDTFHHWDSIVARRRQTMFGGSYWGNDSWYWYSNQTAATVLAYDIATIRKDRDLQDQIIQYFLEKRNHNGWLNTAESAKIVSAILPKVLADRHGALAAPSLSINGAQAITVFPYQSTFIPAGPGLTVSKKGTAPVYFTAYQTAFNPAPIAVSKDFDITTTFQRGGTAVGYLTSVESSEIVVDITSKKYSEYIMIEVPIPAGCTYGPKPQGYGNGEVHREYFRDRVVIFCEAFSPGKHEFHIPLEPRYRGVYTVNPAKVQLMYFPTFFGRTGMKRIAIR